jgi:tetratricopeptide (TPR) repeat protein
MKYNLKNLKIISLFICLQIISTSCIGQRISKEKLYAPTHNEKARFNYSKGTDLMDEGKFYEAIEPLKMAIALDSNYIDAYDNLGLTYRQIGELDSAIHYYNISHYKYPKGNVALMNLGVAYNIKNEFLKGEYCYKKLMKIDKRNPEAYYGLTNTYMMMKMFDKALKNSVLAEKYYRLNNSPKEMIGDCYHLRAFIYQYLNNKKDALMCLDKAIEYGIKVDPILEVELRFN